jgi:hypothetical protein
MTNIILLAEMELQRERIKPSGNLILDRAIRIRHYLDLRERGRAIAEARKNNLV